MRSSYEESVPIVADRRERTMDKVIYLVGLVVVVGAILAFVF